MATSAKKVARCQLTARPEAEKWQRVSLPEETTTDTIERLITTQLLLQSPELQAINDKPEVVLAILQEKARAYDLLLPQIGKAISDRNLQPHGVAPVAPEPQQTPPKLSGLPGASSLDF